MRGCYRREKGGAGGIPPEVEDDPEVTESGHSSDMEPYETSPQKVRRPSKGKAKSPMKKPRRKLADAVDKSESGEFFDLDAVSSGTDDGEVPRETSHPKKRGRPRKILTRTPVVLGSVAPLPRKPPGRPRKLPQLPAVGLTMEEVISKLPLPSYASPVALKKLCKAGASGKTGKKRYHTVAAAADDSGEFFDLNDISTCSEDGDDGVPSAPTLGSKLAMRPMSSAHSGSSTPLPAIRHQTLARHVHTGALSFASTSSLPSAQPQRTGSGRKGAGVSKEGKADVVGRGGPSRASDLNILLDSEDLARSMSTLSLSSRPTSKTQMAMVIDLSD